jgi:hypothetical protein
MRKGIIVTISAADRARTEAVATNRNTPQKRGWRYRIVLLTADGLGTFRELRDRCDGRDGTDRRETQVLSRQRRSPALGAKVGAGG